MKIAHIVRSLNTSHGGPSVSVPKLANALSQNADQVDLLTTDKGKPTSKFSGALHTYSFRSLWPHSLGISFGLSEFLNGANYDLVHSHGVWQRPLHYANVYAKTKKIPFVISPRGMLSPWAWNHNSWKKRLALRYIHPSAFEMATGWHATSDDEANDIRAKGFKQPICIAPNGVDAPTPSEIAASKAFWSEACQEATSRPIALFYSRFHRKKRVLELIDVWLKFAPQDWILLMVGIPQEYSIAQLRDYVLRASGTGRILIFDGTDSPPPYAIASIFLLPSHSENFGMVVAEALSHGLPVLVTDTMPWHTINETDFGWCGPWEMFSDALSSSLALGKDVLQERGRLAKDWVANEYSWGKSAAKLLNFYAELRK